MVLILLFPQETEPNKPVLGDSLKEPILSFHFSFPPRHSLNQKPLASICLRIRFIFPSKFKGNRFHYWTYFIFGRGRKTKWQTRELSGGRPPIRNPATDHRPSERPSGGDAGGRAGAVLWARAGAKGPLHAAGGQRSLRRLRTRGRGRVGPDGEDRHGRGQKTGRPYVL